MEKVVFKIFALIGLILSLLNFFIFYNAISSYIELYTLLDSNDKRLTGLTLALFFTCLFSFGAMLNYLIGNLIVIIYQLIKKVKINILPLAATILCLLITITTIHVDYEIKNFTFVCVFQMIHLAIFILEIIMLIKYFKENKKAPL